MPTNLRFALWFLLLGIVSVTVYHTARDDREPLEEPAEPALEPPAPERNTAATAEAPAFAPMQPLGPVGVPIAPPHTSSQEPRDWSKALVIREKEEAVLSTRVRHRIIEERGFSQPIHIAQAVETNPASGEETTVLISARVANQILLTSIGPVDRHEVADIADSLGWRISPRSQSPYLVVLETEEADFATVDQALEAIQASGTSLVAGPNQIYYASATPYDPRFTANSQWALHQATDIDIDAPEGWDVRRSAASIIVAIVDTGVRLTHEDLRGNIWTNPRDSTRNGRDDDGNGYIDDANGIDTVNDDTLPHDDNGHGTHVAGIVGAVGNNGKGMAGVAWDVQLMAIKSLNADGRGTTTMLVEGIDYAINNGARIINASWASDSYDSAIDLAIQRARERGVLFVAAAGNDGDFLPTFPASLSLDNVVAVGSVSRLGELSDFSNYSEQELDVLAPGEDILSTWHEADDAYTTREGTSAAAPHVSGILALNLAQFPDDDHARHVERLIASSEKRPHLRQYARSGGIVNLAASLQMSRIPVPPRIIDTSRSADGIDEGSAVILSVRAESEMELSYAWYHEGTRLSETSHVLTLENVQPYQRGQYVVEVANADAAVSASFTLEVFPRMREIEALIGASVQVFASHEGHWELVEEEGATAIVNRELAKDVSANLRFISSQPGMLQFFAKKPNATNDFTTTSLSGRNSWSLITEKSWSPLEAHEDWGSGFQAVLHHDSRYHDRATPARSLYLRVPRFFTVEKLPPAIRQHPASQIVRIGETVRLQVSALGQPLQYQWYKDGSPLLGETEYSIEFLVASAEDGGAYYVVVSNSNASITSSHAIVEVDTAPQPASVFLDAEHGQAIESGDPLTLSMRVHGAQPIRYQWYKDGVLIPGANSANLSLGPASVAHNGTYYLSVENDLNEHPAFSPGLSVYVSEQRFPPRFSSWDKQAKTVLRSQGESFSLPVNGVIGGSHPVSFQWFKDGEPFGAAGSEISFGPAELSHAGIYYCEASNQVGLDQSGRIHILITPSLAEAVEYHDLAIQPGWRVGDAQTRPAFQTEESWDGEDAIELNYDDRVGTQSITIKNDERGRVLSFRWKIEQDAPAALSISGLRKLEGTGEWHQAKLLLEPYAEFRIELISEAGKGRAWLDRFEDDKAPYLLKDVSYSLPVAGENVVLSASVFGSGLAYQWYKDDVAIVGAQSATLDIERFAAADVGAYRLEASNSHGNLSTAGVQVGFEAHRAWIPAPLEPTISDLSKATLLREDGEAYLKLDLDEAEFWTLKSPATGPSTLAICYMLLGAEATLRIGEKEYPLIDIGKSTNRFAIPSGQHAVTLMVRPPEAWPEGKARLYSMTLSNSPLAKVLGNRNRQLGYSDVPLAEFAGAEPLTVKWYRDDVHISTVENAKSGQAILFTRSINGHDHGNYHIEVTDAQGNISRSDPYFVNTGQRVNEVIDYPNYVTLFGYIMAVDREVRKKGAGSLRFDFSPSETPGLDVGVQVNLDLNYAYLWIRSAGFPSGSAIRYSFDGGYRTTPANADWTVITVEPDAGTLTLLMPETSGDSNVWIDHLVAIPRAKFIQQPQDVATYLGASVAFEAKAFEHSVGLLDTRWTKDGQPIELENLSQLVIDSVSLDDLGTYQAVTISPNGEIVKSRVATLSLASRELGKAIGYSGARFTIYGQAQWQVDYADSVEGASSLIFRANNPHKPARIDIEVDGPASWGLYSHYIYDANSDFGRWDYHAAPVATAGGSSTLSFGAGYGIRIDGLRLTRLSDLRYEPWIDEKLASRALPLAENSRDREADPDQDGLPNWLEFALGLDPAAPSALPTMGIAPSDPGRHTASIEFYAARSSDYSISYEASFDLANWFAVKPSTQVLHSISGYDRIQATIDLQPSGQRTYFVRWSIEPRSEDQAGAF